MLLRTLILLTLFSLPWYTVRFTILVLPTTLLEIIVLVTVAVWIIEKTRTRTFPAITQPWRVPIALFLLASIIALFTAPQLIPALGHWRAYILEPILFAIVLIDTVKTERDRTHIIYTLAASLVIPVAVALYQQITGNLIPNEFWADIATRRVTSVYGYPNALGLYAVPVLILILGRIFASTPIVIPEKSGIQKEKINRNRFLSLFMSGSPIGPAPYQDTGSGMTMRRALLTFLFLPTTAAIVFTRSKGALLALAVGAAVYCILIAKRKSLTMSALILITAIGIFALKYSINLRGLSTVQGGDSVSVRLTQYRETWEMLRDHPLTGAGLRGYQTAMIPYHTQKHIEIFMYPHNIFLTVWSELGLLGLIAFLWLLIAFFKQSLPTCHSRPVSRYGAGSSGNPDTPPVIPAKAGIQTKKEKTRRFPFIFFSGSPIRSGMTAAASAMTALLVHGLVDVPYFKNDFAVLFWTLIAITIIKKPDTDSARLSE